MRVLGLDLGQVRLGVAISDAQGRLAIPLEIIPRDETGAWQERLAAIVAERGVEQVVVGLPLNLRGEHGPAAEAAQALVAGLSEQLPVPVVTWDERLSTALVEKAMCEAGINSRARRGQTDAAAAAVILQSYLDYHAKKPE